MPKGIFRVRSSALKSINFKWTMQNFAYNTDQQNVVRFLHKSKPQHPISLLFWRKVCSENSQ